MSYLPQPSPSYLRARDPSILAWNRFGNLENVRQHLKFSNTTSTITESYTLHTAQDQEEIEEDEAVRVYLRIKGGGTSSDLYQFDDKVLTCAAPETSQAGRNMRNNNSLLKKYSFTKIYGPQTSQSQIFDNTIKAKIVAFINGENCTLLAYGVSGSGKTYTMMGTADEPGVIPRSLDYLFRSLAPHVNQEPVGRPLPDGKLQILTKSERAFEIQKLQHVLSETPFLHDVQGKSYRNFDAMERRLSVNPVAQLHCLVDIIEVWVSFAEIYNEMIYDLLIPIPSKGTHRNILKLGGLQSNTYIKGLTWIYVRSGAEAYQVMQYGLQNLSYAATSVNSHSSRSHSIFSVKLVTGIDAKQCKVAVFNFGDLAGSERQKKTNNTGNRLMESTKINSSLSVLGRCITCVRNRQLNKDCTKAPFRESKLTHLLQKPLQGKEDILMMVNINPSPDMFDDTQFALQFSAIAKEIVVKIEPSVPSKTADNPHDTVKFIPETDCEWEALLNERDLLLEENTELRNEVALLTLQLSESKLDFQEEVTNIRTQYEDILQLKNEQIKQLKETEDKYRKKQEEESKQQTYELLRKLCGESAIVISDDENPMDNSDVYTESEASDQESFINKSVPDLSSENEDVLVDQ